jgi:pyridoxine 5-phosphate synthase
VHLREDRRHIQDRDVRLLLATVRTGVNLELAAASDVLELALDWLPMAATLVPERREEITTEGGLDLSDAGVLRRVAAAVERLRGAGIRTSLFIAPDPAAVRATASLGVEAVELHTGEYAEAWSRRDGRRGRAAAKGDAGTSSMAGREGVAGELDRLRRSAALARSLDLDVHAGHGLTYENVDSVAAVGEIEELNIGHSVISRAVLVGMERAVGDMLEAIRQARTQAPKSRER